MPHSTEPGKCSVHGVEPQLQYESNSNMGTRASIGNGKSTHAQKHADSCSQEANSAPRTGLMYSILVFELHAMLDIHFAMDINIGDSWVTSVFVPHCDLPTARLHVDDVAVDQVL